MQVAQYANHPPHSNHRTPRKMLRRFGSTLEIATPADALAAARESPQLPMRRPRADAAAATMATVATPSPSSPGDHALPSVQVLEDAVRKELASLNGQEELFLRSTSDLSCLLRDLSHEHGRSYFRYVLRDVFGDKSAIYTARASATDVLAYTQSVLRRLARAIHFAPLVLRASTQYVLREFQREFPRCKSAERIVVGGVLFLRILCPALVKPEAFGFAPHSATSLPAAVQIAKLLQTTLKGQLAPSNQPEIGTVNNFVATYHPFVETFLTRFPQLTSSVANQVQRPAPVTRFASWDALDTSRSTPELPASYRGHEQEDETTRFRGMSLTTPEDLSQRKKKFSLRFW